MKHYSVHPKTKGKSMFESEPVVQVKANSPGEAIAHAHHMIKNHPIMNSHYTDELKAVENAPGGGGLEEDEPLTGGGGE